MEVNDFMLDSKNLDATWQERLEDMHYYERTVWMIYFYESGILFPKDIGSMMKQYPFYLGKMFNTIYDSLSDNDIEEIWKVLKTDVQLQMYFLPFYNLITRNKKIISTIDICYIKTYLDEKFTRKDLNPFRR